MKTKSKVKIVVLVIVLALVVVSAIFIKNYYEDRYVSSDYYTMVPLRLDTTPETIYSQSGEDVGLGKCYELMAYSPKGKAKEVSFNVMVEIEALPEAGDYLKVMASNQIVTKWSHIDKADIPDKALEKIEADASK